MENVGETAVAKPLSGQVGITLDLPFTYGTTTRYVPLGASTKTSPIDPGTNVCH